MVRNIVVAMLFLADASVLVSTAAAEAPTRAAVVGNKDKLPQNDSMMVFAVEPVDIGPGQIDAFKDLSEVAWEKPGSMGVTDYAYYKEAWYLSTNPWPYSGSGHLYLFPHHFPDKDRKFDEARIFAAPGEYEPASICIWPKADVNDVKVTVSDLVTEEGKTISANAVDLKIVKWLYVPTEIDHIAKTVKQTAYMPLVLLRDDGLIKPVSGQGDSGPAGRNVLYGSPAEIVDSDVLKPFDLHKEQLRQVWLTVHVPADAAAGIYKAQIKVAGGEASIEVPMVVQVLSFKLSPSRWTCWMYYAGGYGQVEAIEQKADDIRKKEPLVYQTWRDGGSHFVHSFYKADEQIEQELMDMEAHGVTAAAMYAPVERALKLLESTGFGDGEIYLTTDKIDAEDGSVAKVFDAGYRDVYVMGIDEPDLLANLTLGRELATRATVGAKCWSNMGAGLGSIQARKLDVHGNLRTQHSNRSEVAAWREQRGAATVYGSPYPWLQRYALGFRVAYGLDAWRYGYTGSFDFAYQWHGAWPWDFFSLDTSERFQIGYTLPTAGKPVATLKWECFREGQDDLRYLSTLMEKIDARVAANAEDEKAKVASDYLEKLKIAPQLHITGERNLQDVRLEMVKHILALSD